MTTFTIGTPAYADLLGTRAQADTMTPSKLRATIRTELNEGVRNAYSLGRLAARHDPDSALQTRDHTPRASTAEFEHNHYAMLVRMGDTPEDAAREVAHYRATRNEYGLDAY